MNWHLECDRSTLLVGVPMFACLPARHHPPACLRVDLSVSFLVFVVS